MTQESPGQRSLLKNLFTGKGLRAWLATALSFAVLDVIWLGTIGRPIYAELLGDLLATEAYLPAAVIFYLFFVTTVYGYGVLGAKSSKEAMSRGAALGFVTYTTYELTNWAVIAGWPGLLVPIDIAWGIILTGGASLVGYKLQPFEAKTH